MSAKSRDAGPEAKPQQGRGDATRDVSEESGEDKERNKSPIGFFLLAFGIPFLLIVGVMVAMRFL